MKTVDQTPKKEVSVRSSLSSESQIVEIFNERTIEKPSSFPDSDKEEHHRRKKKDHDRRKKANGKLNVSKSTNKSGQVTMLKAIDRVKVLF